MRQVIVILSIVLLIGASAAANPLPEPLITEVSIDPPWIEILYYYVDELEGEYIYTSGGAAEILSVEGSGYGCAILDSTNTTGFVLDPDGDSISFSFFHYFSNVIGYGTMGELCGAPPPGYTIKNKMYEVWHPGGEWSDVLYYFSFSDEPSPGYWDTYLWDCPHWGSSYLIFNEISLSCNWPTNNDGFIELYNAGSEIITTTGYAIVGEVYYPLPEDIMIFPGEFYVVDQADCPELFANKDSDVIYLVQENSETIDVVDQVGWSFYLGDEISLIRYPEGNVDWSNDADFQGYDSETSYTFEIGLPTRGEANFAYNQGIDKPKTLPEDHTIMSCYPNPFNARTKIDFSLTQPGMVTLSIYDITGRLIETLARQYYPAGSHSVIWDAGQNCSGVYFARIESDNINCISKMVLVK